MNLEVIESLPKLSISPSVAVLSTFDGAVSYRFVCNPERVQHNLMANFAKLPVLNTAQPLAYYQHSDSGLVLPDLKLWTRGNARDLSGPLATLESWTRPDPSQGLPRLLKFTWGRLVVPRCYLESLDYEVIQWRSGAPTSAEATIRLLYAPEVIAPEIEEIPVLSNREVEQYQAELEAKYPDQEVTLDSAGNVTIDGANKGTLSEVLDTVRPGLP